MLRTIFCFLAFCSTASFADTIEHYMNIANNIPQMEIKADPQAQAWARSARNILLLTCENIIETLNLANETAKNQGTALFCMPASVQMSPENLNKLIQATYQEISSQASDKNKMSVSQVALMGLSKQYPCPQNNQAKGMEHANSLPF